MKKKIDARDVAYFFIGFAHEYGDCLTNLKLQKLLYFAQAWYLVFYHEELFNDEIQAWIHGPVIPNVYTYFKKYKWNPITEDAPEKKFPNKIKEHLVNVFEYYMPYSAYELEQITHDADPWIKAREGFDSDELSTVAISLDDMKEYYSSMV